MRPFKHVAVVVVLPPNESQTFGMTFQARLSMCFQIALVMDF